MTAGCQFLEDKTTHVDSVKRMHAKTMMQEGFRDVLIVKHDAPPDVCKWLVKEFSTHSPRNRVIFLMWCFSAARLPAAAAASGPR